jgi:hypothetical protein
LPAVAKEGWNRERSMDCAAHRGADEVNSAAARWRVRSRDIDEMRSGTWLRPSGLASQRVETPIHSLTDTRSACVVLLGAELLMRCGRSTNRSVQRGYTRAENLLVR